MPATSPRPSKCNRRAVALDTASAEHRPHHHREAGHRAAAQRPQLPAAAVPRRRRRRDRRRAGRHAAGRRQRDQHHGRAADVEQLHDRRHGQHRHRRSARPRRFCRSMPSRSSRSRRRPTRRSTGSAPTRSTSSARPARTRCTGTGFGFFRNEALDARNFFDDETRRAAQARSEAVRVRRRRSGACCRSTTGATGRSSWSTTRDAHRARFERVLHRADAGAAGRAASRRRSSIRRPASRSPTTPFRSRASRGWRSWRSGTTGSRRRTSTAAQGNYQPVRTLPQDARPVHDCVATRISASSGRVFVRYTKTTYENRTNSNLHRRRRPRVRAGHAPTGRSRTAAVPQQPRQPVPHRPRRRAGRPGGHPVPAGGRRLPAADRHVHRHSRHPARVSEHRHPGLSRARAARSTPTARATSRCGTSATRPRGSAATTR